GTKGKPGGLFAWVRNPKGTRHETKMPNPRRTEKEAADVTAYLMSLKNDEFLAQPRPALDKNVRDEILLKQYLEGQYSVTEAKSRLEAMDDRQRTLFLGEKTIARYGCFGCHTLSGFEQTSRMGVERTEKGSKMVESLD